MPENKDNQDNIKLRLDFLEEKYEHSHRYFKFTLTAITSTFILVGVIITTLSIFSKIDVNGAIRDMERKFEVLSNQALQKPELELFSQDEPITGKTIKMNIEITKEGELILPLNRIYIKNIGKKKAEDLSIYFCISKPSEDVGEVFFGESGTSIHYFLSRWNINRNGALKNYPTTLKFNEKISLNPNEIWDGFMPFEIRFKDKNMDSFLSKLIVYYGVEKPMETEIVFLSKQETQKK